MFATWQSVLAQVPSMIWPASKGIFDTPVKLDSTITHLQNQRGNIRCGTCYASVSVSHLTLQRSMSSQSVQALPQSKLFLRCRHLLTSARATDFGRHYLCRSPLRLSMELDGQLASESQGNSRCSPCIRHLVFILDALLTACSLTRRAVRLRGIGVWKLTVSVEQ